MNELASLARRAVAAAIDLAAMVLVVLAVTAAAGALGVGAAPRAVLAVAVLLLLVLAQGWADARSGWTFGARLLGLRTVDERWGVPVGPRRMVLRSLVVAAGLAAAGAGALVVLGSALTDPQRRMRGWHDRLAGTVVLHRVAEPVPVTRGVAVASVLGPVRPVPPGSQSTELPVLAFGLMPELEQTHRAAPRPGGDPGAAGTYVPACAELELSDGSRHVVTGTVLLGRNPIAGAGQSALRLPDRSRSSSRTHARLLVTDVGVGLEDVGSTNGTVVRLPGGGQVRCLAGELVQLPAGAFVVLGDCWVRVVSTTPGGPALPEPATER